MSTAKTIVGAIGLTLTVLTAILGDVSGALADNTVTPAEWGLLLTVVIEGVGSVWLIWRVPNTVDQRSVTNRVR
jgi:lipopolysaccharide export LptBFGC system permease protein LptF